MTNATPAAPATANLRFHSHGMLGTWLIGAEEEDEALQVLRSRSLFRHYGPNLLHKTSQLEASAAEALGSPRVLALNSGTSALRCALAALRLEAGDEVLIPACTFVATANAVVLAGGIPVFVEVDETLGIDAGRLSERITPRTTGVIPVHLQGHPCRIAEIASIARGRGLWVLEDAAQAFGCKYDGRSAGCFGDAGAFSLQAHKTITCGEGGLLATASQDIYARARRYSDQGGERAGDEYPDWGHPEAGFGENLKMSELHAGVTLAQLRKVPYISGLMRSIAAQISNSIRWHGRTPRLSPDPGGAIPYSLIFYAHDQYDRDRILRSLAESGVPADTAYSEPLYQLAPFVRWSQGEHVFGLPSPATRPRFEPCPATENLLARMIRIPLSPLYGQPEIALLTAALNAALADSGA